MVDFIGLGAQKSGTSWVYACLYEHPDICAPIKEIHFFSRPRFMEGQVWYENNFKRCIPGKLTGEFSTSYLFSREAPERIKALYPSAKLIAILRNPVKRAISHHQNAIKAGEIADTVTFLEFIKKEPSALLQGLYYEQLERYLAVFPREQMLILIYEDSKKDPATFIKNIYHFLGADDTFVPSMLHSEINVARTPKFVFLDRLMHNLAESLRKSGQGGLVHSVRKSGLTDWLRSHNTKAAPRKEIATDGLKDYFQADVKKLSNLLGRDLETFWGFKS